MPDGTHYYFGPADRSTDIGSLIWVESNGRVVKHRYKILSQVPDGEELTLQILFGVGGDRVEPYAVARDGYAMTSEMTFGGITLDHSYTYVDDRTAPE